MKSAFFKVLLLSGVLTSAVSAFSLYDAAPAVGLPESYKVKYSASVRAGYDSNVGWYMNDEDASTFVNATVSAKYADMESVNKISYDLRLGASHYFDLEKDNNLTETRGDCSLKASMVHAFNNEESLSSALNVTYSPQAEYANGISPIYSSGDMLTTSITNVYTHALDSRWSYNISCSFQSVSYVEAVEQVDDRYYLDGAVGLSYRESSLMTYTGRVSYRRELREYGNDTDLVTATVGFQRSLDPFSSCGMQVGVSARFFSDETIASPYVNLSYRRKLTEGLSMRAYTSYSNENVGTYQSAYYSSYRSNLSWRSGMQGEYALSPDVTYKFGASLICQFYRDGEGNLKGRDYDRLMYQVNAGMRYFFSKELVGDIDASYAWFQNDHSNGTSDANRWMVSAGLTYNF